MPRRLVFCIAGLKILLCVLDATTYQAATAVVQAATSLGSAYQHDRHLGLACCILCACTTLAATVSGSYGMYLAKQGGLVTASTNAASLAQYSNANGELSATAPSQAAASPVPALGSPDLALSPEAGGHVSCHAWQDQSCQC